MTSTLCLQRSSASASSTALLPLPEPYPRNFDSSGPKLARKRCRSLMLKRGVRVHAMCINYVFCGRNWTPAAELRSPPFCGHVAVYDRVSASGPNALEVPLCPEQRSRELIACLRSLLGFLDSHGPLRLGSYNAPAFFGACPCVASLPGPLPDQAPPGTPCGSAMQSLTCPDKPWLRALYEKWGPSARELAEGSGL